MSTSLKLDHVILAVNDLKQARQDFEALGFTVFYGGKHADGYTENCLIVFQDSTYIELISLVDPQAPPRPESMLAQLIDPAEGWTGYALLSDDMERDVQSMRDRGVSLNGPHDNSRHRPDGELVSWRAASLPNTMTPFFIQDRTERTMRVPDDARANHANGVTSIARIVVGVPDLAAAAALYENILDQAPAESSLHDDRVVALDFQLSGTLLTLISSRAADPVLSERLSRRGASVYALHLQTQHATPSPLDPALLHAGVIELVSVQG